MKEKTKERIILIAMIIALLICTLMILSPIITDAKTFRFKLENNKENITLVDITDGNKAIYFVKEKDNSWLIQAFKGDGFIGLIEYIAPYLWDSVEFSIKIDCPNFEDKNGNN